MTLQRILVVHNDKHIRELLDICFRRLGGWDVILAASGKEALAKVQEYHPDAFVLDGMMPEMNELTLLYLLQSKSVSQPIPTILMSGKYNPSASSQLPELGVVLIISKLFYPEELVQRVSQALKWKINRNGEG